MLVEALVALSGWMITAPPAPYELQRATEYQGRQVSYYGRDNGRPVRLAVDVDGAEPPSGQPTGFSDLTDDGRVYGRAFGWVESGVMLTVGLDGKPSDGALQAIAESVQPVPLERWQTLVVATGPAPNTPPPGRRRWWSAGRAARR